MNYYCKTSLVGNDHSALNQMIGMNVIRVADDKLTHSSVLQIDTGCLNLVPPGRLHHYCEFVRKRLAGSPLMIGSEYLLIRWWVFKMVLLIDWHDRFISHAVMFWRVAGICHGNT